MNHGGHSIVLRGLYALQLLPWIEQYPSQIKILSINDIKGSKQQVHFFLLFSSSSPLDSTDTQRGLRIHFPSSVGY
jgi:hypothetical protein